MGRECPLVVVTLCRVPLVRMKFRGKVAPTGKLASVGGLAESSGLVWEWMGLSEGRLA